jgi:hypothetical protein
MQKCGKPTLNSLCFLHPQAYVTGGMEIIFFTNIVPYSVFYSTKVHFVIASIKFFLANCVGFLALVY